MKFDIYSDMTTAQIREELGWWTRTKGEDTISDLIVVCMLLCKKIESLENAESLKENGILPD